MTKIKVYNISQFTSTGKLKKNAKVERSYDECTVQYTSKNLKEWGYYGFSSPYVFAYINAFNDKNEKVLIFERVVFGDKELATSPTKLLAMLQK